MVVLVRTILHRQRLVARIMCNPTQTQEQGACPDTVDAKVAPVAPPSVHLTRLVPCAGPEPGMGSCVRLVSCLHNDVTRHMMGTADDDGSSDDDEGRGSGDEYDHDDDDHQHVVEDRRREDCSSEDVPELVEVDKRDEADSDEEGSFDSEEADDDGGDLVFEPQHIPALLTLLGGSSRVGDVPMQVEAPGEVGEAAVELAAALWNEQLVARVG